MGRSQGRAGKKPKPPFLPKKEHHHKKPLSRYKLIGLRIDRKQWRRNRNEKRNKSGRVVMLHKLPKDTEPAHILEVLGAFGPIMDVRLFRCTHGTLQGAVRTASVEFRTPTAANNAVEGGEVAIGGVQVTPELYNRSTEARDDGLSQELCVKRSIQDHHFWREELLGYFTTRGMVRGPEGFADSTDLEQFYRPTYRFRDLDASIRVRLVSGYASLFYNVLAKQWVTVVRKREGKEAAEVLQRLLDGADTVGKRCAVLEQCTSILSVLTYRRTGPSNPTGLGTHRDQPIYGEAISAVTLSGSCVLKFEFKDPVTQQQMHYEIKQEAGRGYCFSGGWRHSAHHAVSDLDTDGRAVLLWRFWLPGRVGLVPMFVDRDKNFMGYRRLNKKDRIEDNSDFAYKESLKVEPAPIDYSQLEAAIQAASE